LTFKEEGRQRRPYVKIGKVKTTYIHQCKKLFGNSSNKELPRQYELGYHHHKYAFGNLD
jgi:hypothetical protein